MNYFDLPAVSCSDLKGLQKIYNAAPPQDSSAVFRFGSLVDALLTEPWRLHGRVLIDENDKEIEYSISDIDLAREMVKYCLSDPIVKIMLMGAVYQAIIVQTMQISYQGIDFEITGRCKFDLLNPGLNEGIDYKTTSCTSKESFIKSIFHFGYDMQAAWYMDLTGTNRHWIIGISKKTKQIYKYVIQRDDEAYKSGRQKYLFWAFKWNVLIENFAA